MTISGMWQIARCLTVAVLVPIFGFSPASAPAQSHVVSPSDLRNEVAAASSARQHNLKTVNEFLSSPKAEKVFANAGIGASELKTAVSSLNDQELAQLAARAEDADRLRRRQTYRSGPAHDSARHRGFDPNHRRRRLSVHVRPGGASASVLLRRIPCRRAFGRLARCSIREAGEGRVRRCQYCDGHRVLARPGPGPPGGTQSQRDPARTPLPRRAEIMLPPGG